MNLALLQDSLFIRVVLYHAEVATNMGLKMLGVFIYKTLQIALGAIIPLIEEILYFEAKYYYNFFVKNQR
jgi:hypothetical protein